jgi:DNA gyrase/topoisomerase IV subunit B
MEKEELEFDDLLKHIRKRPRMYVGNDDFIGLLKGLFSDFVKIVKTDSVIFKFKIFNDFNTQISFFSPINQNLIFDIFKSKKNNSNYFPIVLLALSEFIEFKSSNNFLIFNFRIAENISFNRNIDFKILSDVMEDLSILNRNSKIIITDRRKKILSQNYYHNREGIFYLLNRRINEIVNYKDFFLTYDNSNYFDYKIQFGIVYRKDWFPEPHIECFANDIRNVQGGSLFEGIFNGLYLGCKKYVRNKELIDFKITKKKLINGLILICAIRGENFEYGGSWRETLIDDKVKKLVEKTVKDLVFNYLSNYKDVEKEFLWRFDRTQLTSFMY